MFKCHNTIHLQVRGWQRTRVKGDTSAGGRYHGDSKRRRWWSYNQDLSSNFEEPSVLPQARWLLSEVRHESITAYVCCRFDDDRIFVLYLLSWKPQFENWPQLLQQRCKNGLNQTYLVGFFMFFNQYEIYFCKNVKFFSSNCYFRSKHNVKYNLMNRTRGLGLTGAFHTHRNILAILYLCWQLWNHKTIILPQISIKYFFIMCQCYVYLIGMLIFPQSIGISALVTYKLIICGHITELLCWLVSKQNPNQLYHAVGTLTLTALQITQEETSNASGLWDFIRMFPPVSYSFVCAEQIVGNGIQIESSCLQRSLNPASP